MTTVFDAAGKGSAKACWAFMRRARADRFETASSAAKPSLFQGGASCKIKKPDMYWSAHRGAERPVISVVKIGYVRRSEIMRLTLRSTLCPDNRVHNDNHHKRCPRAGTCRLDRARPTTTHDTRSASPHGDV